MLLCYCSSERLYQFVCILHKVAPPGSSISQFCLIHVKKYILFYIPYEIRLHLYMKACFLCGFIDVFHRCLFKNEVHRVLYAPSWVPDALLCPFLCNTLYP